MFFGVKNLPFVMSTQYFTSCATGLRNVAAIGWTKMAYPNVKKIIKIKTCNGFDNFLCYLAANMYGYVCLPRSRKFVRSVIIWEHDGAFLCFHIFR